MNKNYVDTGAYKNWLQGEVFIAWQRYCHWRPSVSHGFGATISLTNGEQREGHYILYEQDATTACCRNKGKEWTVSNGFPKDDQGRANTLKDYQESEELQRMVVRAGCYDYNEKSLGLSDSEDEQPVIVSFEGVVMQGQLRTMAGHMAAVRSKDTAYIDYLRNHCQEYGFTRQQVDSYPHPRLALQLKRGEVKTYDREEFALYDGATEVFRRKK